MLLPAPADVRRKVLSSLSLDGREDVCSPPPLMGEGRGATSSPLMLKRDPLILPLSGGDSEGVVDGFSGTPCVLASLARVPLASRRGEGLSAG